MTEDEPRAARPATFRDVFTVGQFRVLWLAHLQSVLGDQLARVALSILVFDRTGSPAWAAITYAMTILPNLAGGALLSGLADRFPRRAVMVTADVLRAVLVAVMALPGQPILVMVVLLAVVQVLYAPFTAARSAVMPAVLEGDRFIVGTAVMRTTDQLGHIAGFGVGAALVTALGTHTTLAVDAGTFALSALLLALGVRPHRPPASGTQARGARAWWHTLRAGFSLVTGDRRLRALIGLACVSGFYVIPEGLAVPYAAQIHGGTLAVGLLLAANPVGAVLGMLTLKSVRPDRRLRLMGPLAVATCAVLMPTAWAPPLAVTVVLWVANGFFSAYDMVANTTFVQIVPDASRGQAIGLAVAAMQTAQGGGVVIGGLLAQAITPAVVIGLAGLGGTVAAMTASAAWSRTTPLLPRTGQGRGATSTGT
ncbi:MFS transporter [Amycolatopsis saalfeldensis]|uniref:Predicted arabinose efflux permease, MFS family n=1 Tax=Amycolatopsis saalfeldensis TaxID=394193 RepID=A0A1H8YNV5_9PSEU|nr:MFS transporter [Amycolatopsis saalfeldensis]SEP53712.1 Predicted arabinose efflux permease, MFS family [Amycolatopsis saalfeldensis]